MKAMAVSSVGPVDNLKLMELPEPRPERGEVRVHVHGSSVSPADIKVITGKTRMLHGLRFPLVAGYDFAGEVDAVGTHVGDLRVGDRVFGFLPYSFLNRQGAFSEKIVVPSSHVAFMPSNLSYDSAGTCATAALSALRPLRSALKNAPDDPRVLINGAAGGVGSYAVQIARILGAEVTGVCSAETMNYVRELGAHDVLDYRKVNFKDLPNKYFAVFDVVSNQNYFRMLKHILPGGTYIRTLPSASLVAGLVAQLVLRQKCRLVAVQANRDDLRQIARWIERGRLNVPVDTVYPLTELPAALHHLEHGGVRGKIGIHVA